MGIPRLAPSVIALTGAFALALLPVFGTSTSALEAPDDPAAACEALAPKAPVLDADTRADGSPIEPADPRSGPVQPVVVVHGWTSRSLHDQTRSGAFSSLIDRSANDHGGVIRPESEARSSLIGALQSIDGVLVHTFDYSKVATRWVTDPQIAPRLADGIECLAKAYGTKPVVLAHSMGGLATRQALSLPDSQGRPLAESVARVVTFGTPEEGTTILKGALDAIDGAMWVPGLNIPVAIFKTIASQCSKRVDATGEYCMGGNVVDSLYTRAARAMLPGTPELAALPWWPEGLRVTALAGNIEVGGFSLFGLKAKGVDIGDMAVNTDSAVAGADEEEIAHCEYGVASAYSAKEGWLRLTTVGRADVERPSALFSPKVHDKSIASPCFHSNLMSETGLTSRALAIVEDLAKDPVPASPLVEPDRGEGAQSARRGEEDAQSGASRGDEGASPSPSDAPDANSAEEGVDAGGAEIPGASLEPSPRSDPS